MAVILKMTAIFFSPNCERTGQKKASLRTGQPL